MNRDTLVGIVGAVVLVSAMVGVFMYERSRAADIPGLGGGGAGGFELVTVSGPGASGTTALGATTDETLAISRTDLTEGVFRISWSSDMSRNKVVLTVTPPADVGSPVTVEGDSGSLEAKIAVPNMEGSGSLVGTGDWKVSVTFESATIGTPVPLPADPPVGRDGSITWTLESTLKHYEPATE